MKKLSLLLFILISVTSYSDAQGLIQGVTLNEQRIGSSGNLVNIVDGGSTMLDVNQTLNTVVFIHRNDGTLFPNSNTGNYRFDISKDMGATWNLNNGPINNSPLLTTGYYNARFPQCAIYNPSGNTIVDSAYLIYSGAWHNDPGTNTGQWMGQMTGRGKLSGDTTTFNLHIDTVNNGNVLTPQSFCQGAPGVFWNITNDYNGSFVANSAEITNGWVVMKGVWNNTSKDVVWTSQNLLASFQTSGSFGYTLSEAFAPSIAFDPTGTKGWIACLGNTNSGDSVLYPMFWNTINGGTTWNGPFTINLDSLTGVQDSLATIGYSNEVIPSVSTAVGEAKLVVDYLGNPHLLTPVTNSAGGYDFYYSLFSIYDITFNSSSCTPNWNGWSAGFVSRCQTITGTYTSDAQTEENRPLVSRSADATKLFFYWLDTDNSVDGSGANSHPNLFTRAYDLKGHTSTPVINLTAGDPLFGGQTAMQDAGEFEIGANFPTVSLTALQSGNNYTVPLVLTQIDYVDYPNGGGMGSSSEPAAYYYINNITYTPTDFINSLSASINRVGADTIYLVQGSTYTDPGATIVYGDTSCYHTGNLHVVVITSGVNFNTPGFYTVYYYAEDASGNIYATTTRNVEIYTVGSQPDAYTGSATNITGTTATLNGIIDGYGSATSGIFQYGLTASYGLNIGAIPGSVTGNGIPVSAAITGLTPNTLYHYRLYAQSSNGVSYGADSTFITGFSINNVCTPAVGDTGMIGPDASLVPCITEGQSFSQTFTLQVPDSVFLGGTWFHVDSVIIDSVENLPGGFGWTASRTPATYSGGTSGCFLVNGTTNAACGQYYMRIIIRLYLDGFFTNLQISTDAFTGSSEYLRVIAPGNNCPAVNRSQTVAYVPYATCSAAGLSLSTSSTSVSCYGGNNGTATVTATGGTTYTYLWNNGGTTSSITGLIAGTYRVTVSSNGSTASSSATVSQPGSSVTTSMSSTQSSCSSNTGTASVTASGGSPGYTYIWNNFSTNFSISNLPSGSYTVTVTDQHGCSAIGSVNVSNPSAFTLQTNSTNVSCYNGSNGSATASATNGTSPFTYVWSTSATTSTISNLGSGVYNVTVKDGNGCSQFASVTINEPNTPLSVSASATPTSCGGNTGSASATVSGNSGSVTYDWSNGAQTSAVSNLQQGLYIITVTSNGCSATAETNVNSSAAYTVTIDSVSVLCYGASTGSAGVLVTGASGNVTYAWNTGASSSSVNNLSAGLYSVTITDGSGCSKTEIVSISQPAVPLAVTTSSTSSTCGNATGSASAVTTGNTGSVSYVWSNSSTQSIIIDLSQGIYTVTVTSGGCSATSSAIVNNTNGPSVTVLQTDPTCFNSNNGSATLVVSGGSSPYSYTWSNASTASSITGAGSGTYTVIVTDASNCQATKTVTLTQPNAITFNPTIANVNCFGDNTGSISLSVAGGTSPYGYTWNNSSASSAINNLTAGSYAVTVIDSKSCSASFTSQITQPSVALSLTTSSTGSSINTGTATCIATGGTTPYSYSWSNGQNNPTISGLPSGTISVTVTDGKNCTATASVTVNPLGINTVKNTIASVSLFPNPANDIVHVVVELSAPQELQFNVFDVTGRLIESHNESSAGSINYNLDVTTLASGVYVMEITAGENSVRKRFVITK